MLDFKKYSKCLFKEGEFCKIKARKVKCEFFLKGSNRNYCLVERILNQLKQKRSTIMYILDDNKKVEDLTEEEFVKFEIMKSIATAKGLNVYEPLSRVQINFTTGSNFSKAADSILAKFDVKFKKGKEPTREVKKEIDVEEEDEIIEEDLLEDDVEENEDPDIYPDGIEDDGSGAGVSEKSRVKKKKKKKKKQNG
jgi:hypothetical protein